MSTSTYGSFRYLDCNGVLAIQYRDQRRRMYDTRGKIMLFFQCQLCYALDNNQLVLFFFNSWPKSSISSLTIFMSGAYYGAYATLKHYTNQHYDIFPRGGLTFIE